MKKLTLYIFSLFYLINYAQKDYSENWYDVYSYNNVLNFYNDKDKIIAITDNALFIYDKATKESKKISSINGLSGFTCSSFYYDKNNQLIVMGYNNGMIDIIDKDFNIVSKPDIINFNIAASKSINNISPNGNDELLISTGFAIIGFDLKQMTFKDTYFIGNNSTTLNINATTTFKQKIYAATDQGLFVANAKDPFLVDYTKWKQLSSQAFYCLNVANNQVSASSDKELYFIDKDSLLLKTTAPSKIKSIRSSEDKYIILSMDHGLILYDINYNGINNLFTHPNDQYYFDINSAIFDGETLTMATDRYGILKTSFKNPSVFEEIHPKGPLNNNPFSISVSSKNLWVVYGGYDEAYTPNALHHQRGVSHFNGESWKNLQYRPGEIQVSNFVHVNIDPNHENRVYLSSFGEGILIIENDKIKKHWTHKNSGLEKLFYPKDTNYISTRISSSTFDKNGNLWVANSAVDTKLKKFNGKTWSGINLNDIIINKSKWGLNELIIDKSGNKWIGTRSNGALVCNEDGSKIMSFTSNQNHGNLPDLNVRALAVDSNNRVWIGTKSGLRIYDSNPNMFDKATYQTDVITVALNSEDNYGEALMGKQSINSICIDGADNIWFGTENGGVICTNNTGKETLYQFDIDNSPLPSNRVLKIQLDKTNGYIYIATDKGIVCFDSQIVPYTEHLVDAYAYPNPVKAKHDFVTIDGRNGNHLPYDTNIKILDTSGTLVFETNTRNNQQEFGGKVVWNKCNLAGKKVASGIYIVLLSYDGGKETAMTKIAIIN